MGFVVAHGIVLVLNVALHRREDAVLQMDCTLSIRFEGREAYPRVHRDNKSKHCATPSRLNPKQCRAGTGEKVGLVTVRRSPQCPDLKSVAGREMGKFLRKFGVCWNCIVLKRVRVTVGARQDRFEERLIHGRGNLWGNLEGREQARIGHESTDGILSWDVRYGPHLSTPLTQFLPICSS